jgi:flagellar basal body-associated protein FliL
MALIECKNCGNKISEFAEACPKCGASKNDDSKSDIKEDVIDEIKIETVLPPPITAEKETEKTANTNTGKSPIENEVPNKRNNSSKIIIISLVAVILLLVILFVSGVFDKGGQTDSTSSPAETNRSNNSSNSENENESQESEEEEEVDYEPEDEEYIEDYEGEDEVTPQDVENSISYYASAKVDYRQKLITGVYDIQVALTNNSPYTMESVRVEVQYQRINNKVFDREYLYFTNIAPYSTITMDAPNKSEGSFVACQAIEGKVSK